MTEPRTGVYIEFSGYAEPRQEPTEEHPANAYFSQGADGYHYPCIDIDIPVRLVPSSTPGHSHLYVDKPITWDTYKNLLVALAEAGIVEGGYLDASVAQGGTTVRMPHVKKGVEPF